MAELLAISSKNIQKLKLFRLEGISDRPLTKILGENGQGKSTVLNLLFWLFYTKALPEEVITHGETSASIVGEFDIPDSDLQALELDLEGGTYIIRKNFSPSGTTLKVYPKDKMSKTVSSPQEFINKVLSLVSFNPLEFCDAPKDKQDEMLLKLIGLEQTLKDLDVSYDATYKEREGINREAKQLKTLMDKTPKVDKISKKDLFQIFDKRDKAAKKNAENKEQRERYEKLTQERDDLVLDGTRLKTEKDKLEEELKRIQERLAEVNETLEQKRASLKDLNMKLAVLVQVVDKLKDIDLSIYDDEIRNLEEHNKQATLYEQRMEFEIAYEAKKAIADELTESLKNNREERKRILKEAEYPLKGLEYTEDGVRYNGTLIESLSRAEKLLVGLSIMSALDPTLKLAVIDDGERLVGKNREIVKRWAEHTGIHVLLAIASPSDTEEDGIVIEDGEIIRSSYEESDD